MYLSKESIHALTTVVTDFEVVLRTFVAKTLSNVFHSATEVKDYLKVLSTSQNANSIIFSNRFNSKVKALQGKQDELYNFISQCCIPHASPSNVPYVSALADYIALFYNPYFRESEIAKGYSPTSLMSSLQTFVDIRNGVAHPASVKISTIEARSVVEFIENSIRNLSDFYFWYSGKDSIKKGLITFKNSTTSNNNVIHNFNDLPKVHKQLISRDSEIVQLKQSILGEIGTYYRKARSVVVYGYGGLGKTALVVELFNIIMKEINDTNNSYNIDYMLFFSAKQEKLDIIQTTGEYIINEECKRFSTFDDLQKLIYTHLNIKDTSDIANYRGGIIAIDNIETMSPDDKIRLMKYIRTLPDSCQIILTSREEESVDEKFHLQGFEEIDSGYEFITKYIECHQLNIAHDFENFKNLVLASKGNTLILVLSLLRMHEGTNIEDILSELNSTSSSTVATLSEFMYKNTFDKEIIKLNAKGIDAKKVLSTIAYYQEPIDLYSLVVLSKIGNLAMAEDICNELTQALILAKTNDMYELNDFAAKFILVKIIPNKVEAMSLSQEVSTYKFNRRQKLRRLDEILSSNAKLRTIMNDWAPRNNIERMSIAEAFALFSRHRFQLVSKTIKEFDEILAYSQHPFVKFQRARIFQDIIKQNGTKPEYLNIITKSYEEAIWSMTYDYTYMLQTKSYAATLWFYALFLMNTFDDHSTGVQYLEKAYEWHVEYKIDKETQNKIANDLKSTYWALYKKTKNNAYKAERDRVILL